MRRNLWIISPFHLIRRHLRLFFDQQDGYDHVLARAAHPTRPFKSFFSLSLSLFLLMLSGESDYHDIGSLETSVGSGKRRKLLPSWLQRNPGMWRRVEGRGGPSRASVVSARNGGTTDVCHSSARAVLRVCVRVRSRSCVCVGGEEGRREKKKNRRGSQQSTVIDTK